MTIMMQGLYNALISVGADKEVAAAAAMEAADLDSRFTKLESLTREETASIRADFREESASIRAGFREESASIRADFAALAGGIREGFSRMELAVEKRVQAVEREISVLKWMVGVMIALSVAGFGWMTSLILNAIG